MSENEQEVESIHTNDEKQESNKRTMLDMETSGWEVAMTLSGENYESLMHLDSCTTLRCGGSLLSVTTLLAFVLGNSTISKNIIC